MSPPTRPGGPLTTSAVVIVLSIVLICSMFASISLGAASFPLSTTLSHLWAGLHGGSISSSDVTSYTVISQIRAPRVLLAALVGAGLSVLGIAAQAMVRNPLADPFILGISSGASVGAAAVISLGIFSSFGVYGLSLAAFIGALIASVLVYALSGGLTGQAPGPNRLILTGVVLSFGFQAITSTIIFFEPRGDAARTVMFWLLGSLGGANWSQLPVTAAAVAGSIAVMFLLAPRLDILSTGDTSAAALGIDPARLRLVLFILTALGTGILVSVSGTIGFVGLVVPHLVRMVLGPAHRRLIVLAPFIGAILMVWVDLLSRVLVSPRELPLGVVTALVGVPVFLLLVRRRSYVFGGSK